MSHLRSNIALGLSGTALLIAIYATFMQPASNKHATHSHNGEELAELKQQMLVYQRALVRIESAGNHQTSAAANAEQNPKTEQPMERLKAEIVSFESPDGLRVRTGENGAISVINSDKRLTGKVMAVKARRTDGTEENITIIVPAPGS